MGKNKKPAPSLPPSLNDRERYLLEIEEVRFGRARRAAAAGVVLLAVALGFGCLDDPDPTCATDLITKTTTEQAPATNGKAAVPTRTSEVSTTRDCSVPAWPKVPIALGGLGLILAAPYLLRLLAPGSKFALGNLLSLESGPDAVLADHVKQSSESELTPLLAAAERRMALSITIADAPTASNAGDGNQGA